MFSGVSRKYVVHNAKRIFSSQDKNCFCDIVLLISKKTTAPQQDIHVFKFKGGFLPSLSSNRLPCKLNVKSVDIVFCVIQKVPKPLSSSMKMDPDHFKRVFQA